MASLTIRNLDNDLKQRLRIRAAGHGRSMEEEARHILRETLATPSSREEQTGAHLWDEIRALVEPMGGIELELPARDAPRALPDFSPRKLRSPRKA